MTSSEAINSDDIKSTQIDSKKVNNSLSLETLILLVNAERIKYLQQKSEKEFSELKEGQDAVAKLHKLLQKIHAEASDTGELKPSEELKQLLKEAKDLGVDIPEKATYTKAQRELLENDIQKMTDDLNLKNEMKLQKTNRIIDEVNQSWTQARNLLKTLHELKMYTIKAFSK